LSPEPPDRSNWEELEREGERHLTGKESEPWELMYFKVYKSPFGVIERALETATLKLGTDKPILLLFEDARYL
jgi:hypothetical protein